MPVSAASLPKSPLALNAHGRGVLRLETALSKLGKLPNDKYSHDSYFGTLTRDALKQLQSRHRLPATGAYDAATRTLLGKLLSKRAGAGAGAGAGSGPGQATGSTSAGGAEPAANYSRVHFRGVTVNVRTRTMLLNAEKNLRAMGVPWKLALVQGSFSTSVAASGGTHDGGGAVDISVRGPNGAYLPYSQVAKGVKALRMAGFAAWSRGYDDGTTFSKHIHMIAIGDKQLSHAARSQVRDYFAGKNGLVNRGVDRDHSVGRPIPAWANKYR